MKLTKWTQSCLFRPPPPLPTMTQYRISRLFFTERRKKLLKKTDLMVSAYKGVKRTGMCSSAFPLFLHLEILQFVNLYLHIPVCPSLSLVLCSEMNKHCVKVFLSHLMSACNCSPPRVFIGLHLSFAYFYTCIALYPINVDTLRPPGECKFSRLLSTFYIRHFLARGLPPQNRLQLHLCLPSLFNSIPKWGDFCQAITSEIFAVFVVRTSKKEW